MSVKAGPDADGLYRDIFGNAYTPAEHFKNEAAFQERYAKEQRQQRELD
jgi:hypothetical protein